MKSFKLKAGSGVSIQKMIVNNVARSLESFISLMGIGFSNALPSQDSQLLQLTISETLTETLTAEEHNVFSDLDDRFYELQFLSGISNPAIQAQDCSCTGTLEGCVGASEIV